MAVTTKTAERSVRSVELALLRLESCARETVDDAVVADYAAAMKAGRAFPPVLVYEDAGVLWLVDGLHRVKARQANGGDTTILAEVRRGCLDDAVWESCSANKSHGLRRSNADKRRSTERALLLPKGQRLSDRQIAAHCGVHHHTVGRIRAQLEASGALRQMTERMASRGGVAYLLRTENVSESNRRRADSASAVHRARSVSDSYELAPRRAAGVAAIHQHAEIEENVSRPELKPLRSTLPAHATPADLHELLDCASQHLRQAAQCLEDLLDRHFGTPGLFPSAGIGPLQVQVDELRRALERLATPDRPAVASAVSQGA